MLPRGRVYRYPSGRGMPDVSIPGVGGMLPIPYGDMAAMPLRDAPISQPVPIGALASALANASPEQQRTVGLNFLLMILLPFFFHPKKNKKKKTKLVPHAFKVSVSMLAKISRSKIPTFSATRGPFLPLSISKSSKWEKC